MSDTTAIHWCDGTVNPTMGCDGCELWCEERRSCYAAILHQMRGGNRGHATDFNRVERFPGRVAKDARLSDLTGLRHRHKPWLDGLPRIIFISDMGDSLSQAISFEYLEAEVIDNVTSSAGRRHRWLWLTKRPKRMAEFLGWLKDWGRAWPENLWAGTSVTMASTVSRLDGLLKVGDEQTNRFVSVEPQLESVDLRQHLPGLRWVIQGGESGNDPRPFDVAWARDLRGQCRDAGVDYFLKQLGSNPYVEGKSLHLRDGHGADWGEWPEDLRIREVPGAIAPEDESAGKGRGTRDHEPGAPDAVGKASTGRRAKRAGVATARASRVIKNHGRQLGRHGG